MSRYEELTEEQRELIHEASCLRPLNSDWFERATAAGMIARKDLKDGVYYLSDCRNANVAMWSEKDQEFKYMRTKFTMRFVDTIEHPEDDKGFDLFVPFKEVEPTEDERVK